MDTKVNYTIVGLFVITLLAAIVLGIIWLSAGFSNKSYNVYLVFMKESVTGLTIDSPVKYNGVDVGTVKDIKLNPVNPQEVELFLNIEHDTPITKGTTATLTTQGITGVAYIDLRNTGPDQTPLLPSPKNEFPIIKSAPSLFMRLDMAVNVLTNSLSKIGNSINSTFNPENRKQLGDILVNLNRITTTLAGDSEKMDRILKNTAAASDEFPVLIKNGQSVAQTLNKQTLPQVHQVLETIQGLSTNLLDTSRTLKQNPSILVRGKAPRAPGPGER